MTLTCNGMTIFTPMILATALGCSGGSSMTIDGSTASDGTIRQDLSGLSCTEIPTWIVVDKSGGFDRELFPGHPGTFAESIDSDKAPFHKLRIEDYSADGNNISETYNSSSTFNDCTICPKFYDCDGAGLCASAKFFAQGGTVRVLEASKDTSQGLMTVDITDLRLVEWDFGPDKPVANPRCFDIGTAHWTSTWGAR